MAVAAYIESSSRATSDPTVKQHLAAIRMLFDWLVTGQVMRHQPGRRRPRPQARRQEGQDARAHRRRGPQLLDSIPSRSAGAERGEPDTRPPILIGLRDRALIGVMVYSFARVGAVVGMKVEDYYTERQPRLVPPARERRQAARSARPSQRRGLPRCLHGSGRHRRRPQRPPSSAPSTGTGTLTDQPAAPQQRPRHDQAAGQGGRAFRRRSATTPSGPPASPPTWKTAARIEKAQQIANHESAQDHQALRPHQRPDYPR